MFSYPVHTHIILADFDLTCLYIITQSMLSFDELEKSLCPAIRNYTKVHFTAWN